MINLGGHATIVGACVIGGGVGRFEHAPSFIWFLERIKTNESWRNF